MFPFSLRDYINAISATELEKPMRSVFILACSATVLFILTPLFLFIAYFHAPIWDIGLFGFLLGISGGGFLFFLLLAFLIEGVCLNSRTVRRWIIWFGLSLLPVISAVLFWCYAYVFLADNSAICSLEAVASILGIAFDALLIFAVGLAFLGWGRYTVKCGDWS